MWLNANLKNRKIDYANSFLVSFFILEEKGSYVKKLTMYVLFFVLVQQVTRTVSR